MNNIKEITYYYKPRQQESITVINITNVPKNWIPKYVMQKLTVKRRNIVHNNHYRFHYSIQINAQNIQAEVMHGNVGQREPQEAYKIKHVHTIFIQQWALFLRALGMYFKDDLKVSQVLDFRESNERKNRAKERKERKEGRWTGCMSVWKIDSHSYLHSY